MPDHQIHLFIITNVFVDNNPDHQIHLFITTNVFLDNNPDHRIGAPPTALSDRQYAMQQIYLKLQRLAHGSGFQLPGPIVRAKRGVGLKWSVDLKGWHTTP